MLPSADPPFIYFTDLGGDPLDSGYIYIGAAGQNPETEPVAVYWDVAGTQPAAQPIRTLNGHPVRNGSPAQIYVASNYSITVRNKRRQFIFYEPDSSEYSIKFIRIVPGGFARSILDKLAEQLSVKDFGAIGDGVTDDTAAIQAAEDYLAANGKGTLLFPSGMYKISSTLTKRATDVLWVGEGVGQQHDAGAGDDFASGLTWAGAAGGTMIDFAPATGASARRISGGGVICLGLYGRGVAAIGLSAKSITCCDIDIYIEDFTSQGLLTGVVAPLGEAADFRENRIRVYGKQVNAGSGNIARFDGSAAANTCYNTIDVRGLYKFAAAVVMGSTDNNWLTQWTFRFGGGTGLGVDALGGATLQEACRANIWAQCYYGDGGFTSRGTADYPFPANNNVILSRDSDNVQPAPVIGTGATLTWHDSDGSLSMTDIGINRPAANTLGLYGAGGAYVVRWTAVLGANSRWEVSHGPGTVSLGVSGVPADITVGISTKGSGVGTLYGNGFASAMFKWNFAGVGFNGTNPIAKPTVTGAKGGNAALASLLSALSAYGLITDSST